MNHFDHVRLLSKGVPAPGGTWADFGSGGGAFTLALADLIGPTGKIYSIDQDQSGLRDQEHAMRARFPSTTMHHIRADFSRELDLPLLDGIVMANALHFQKHDTKGKVLGKVFNYLRPGGRLILVEYNVDRGNMWVPYPLSYPTWEDLARWNGFVETRLLATVPSRFLVEIYSAQSLKPMD